MITAIIFLFVLSILVFVHELGHFIVAKMAGMKVDEFGIGFPPKAFSWKRGETTYSINFLPFGGFVKIHGEDQSVPIEGKDKDRSFGAKPRYWQAAVLLAGVTCNVLFAYVLISVGLMYGFPISTDFHKTENFKDIKVIITQVIPESPAFEAGLQPGDRFISLKSQDKEIQPTTTKEVQDFISSNSKSAIVIDFKRGDTSSTTKVIPVLGLFSENPAIGVGLDSVGLLSLPVHKAFISGAELTYVYVYNTTKGLGQFIYKSFKEENALSSITGPIGIAGMVGDAREMGFVYLLSFVSFISINLAVINLIPFPALDGGRLIMVIIEAIVRRPIPVKVSNILNAGGFMLLILLMLIVTYNDLIRIFFK